MTAERPRFLYPSTFLLLFVLFAPSALIGPPVAGADLLADKHASAGVSCTKCHKSVPPVGPEGAGACVGCHGDLPKVAERTQRLAHNPHSSHRDDLECDACHHAHKPSVDRCTPCHQFGFRVP
jgi:hypothetical protein